MISVGKHVRRLLPTSSSWPSLPDWPPDLFCVAASLVQASGLYAHPRYVAGWRKRRFFGGSYVDTVRKVGGAWRASRKLEGEPRRIVESCWADLKAHRGEPVSRVRVSHCGWWDSALYLMSIADEASRRIGFGRTAGFPHAEAVLREYERWEDDGRKSPIQLPYSLAKRVPADAMCVLPKTRTPQTGCTVRSLSHHLALLPPAGDLRCAWLPGNLTSPTEDRFNLLLVPFPYNVRDDAISAAPHPKRGDGYFALQQTWLPGANEFAEFIRKLIWQARRRGVRVDGVVLPEASLSRAVAEEVVARLADEGLELFVAGVLEEGKDGAFNLAFLVPRFEGKVHYVIEQAKHHRWKLNKDQIDWYGLPLDSSREWWEKIDIAYRTLCFHVFRHGACLTTLICEDLARIDPVQTAIRAVGPNLVIALLMDGEQLLHRWSARYATVLADDPGSAVLTLTCVGMVRRGTKKTSQRSWSVGLWREPGTPTQQLRLPRTAHGLILRLKAQLKEEMASDGRGDGGGAVEITLESVECARHPNPPLWARL